MLAPWALFAAWGTAKTDRLALWLALIFCGVCDLLFAAAILYLGALVLRLGGAGSVSAIFALSLWQIVMSTYLIFGAPVFIGFLSNLMLTFALIFKIRKRAATLDSNDFDDR